MMETRDKGPQVLSVTHANDFSGFLIFLVLSMGRWDPQQMHKSCQEIPLEGALWLEKGKGTGWGVMVWPWGKTHVDSTGLDAQVLQILISRIPAPRNAFSTLTEIVYPVTELLPFFSLSWFNCMWRAKAREEGQQRVGSDREGMGPVVFHGLWKHLHACVSSPPLLLASDWPLSGEMAPCPRD